MRNSNLLLLPSHLHQYHHFQFTSQQGRDKLSPPCKFVFGQFCFFQTSWHIGKTTIMDEWQLMTVRPWQYIHTSFTPSVTTRSWQNQFGKNCTMWKLAYFWDIHVSWITMNYSFLNHSALLPLVAFGTIWVFGHFQSTEHLYFWYQSWDSVSILAHFSHSGLKPTDRRWINCWFLRT